MGATASDLIVLIVIVVSVIPGVHVSLLRPDGKIIEEIGQTDHCLAVLTLQQEISVPSADEHAEVPDL